MSEKEVKKESKKISMSTFLLIIAIVVLILLGYFSYKIYTDKKAAEEQVVALTEQVEKSQKASEERQEVIDEISTIINEETEQPNVNKTEYEVTKLNDNTVKIQVNVSSGNTVTKEVQTDSAVYKLGVANIPNVGDVALVSESGGEYLGVHVYKLINEEIRHLGDIDCGADMYRDATYTVEKKNENTVNIKAKAYNKEHTNEFKMSGKITNTCVIDILDLGKVVLVSETSGEYFGIQAYRLSVDYTTGVANGIKNVGTLKNVF